MDPTGPGDHGQLQDDEPCEVRHKAKLSFTAHRIFRVGQKLVALDISATRTAILDKCLNFDVERSVDRAGADVTAGETHTQNLPV